MCSVICSHEPDIQGACQSSDTRTSLARHETFARPRYSRIFFVPACFRIRYVLAA